MFKRQKVINFSQLSTVSGVKVLCHGVFDVIHAGHLAYFEAAKKFGDTLIVSITTDQYVNKGPGRPYFTAQVRAKMIEALDVVDHVVISDYPTATPVIHELKPHFYVKGPDYKDLSKDVTGEIYHEKEAIEKYGELVFTEEETFSSSAIINSFFQERTEEQRTIIARVQEAGGTQAILSALEAMAKLRVLVLGEPILDVYRFVRPEGLSSKSPSISARFDYEESYHGGTWAIAAHLRDFVSDVKLFGPEPCEKVRYISGSQRIFEVTDINETFIPRQGFYEDLHSASLESDVIVAADFGHGFFEVDMLDIMPGLLPFIGLNVQANSSNFGFNTFRKHGRFDYLCLDTREARLALCDRFTPPLYLGHRIANEVGRPVGLTLGSNGAYLFSSDLHFSPAFSDVVVDATGAGDAYFAITTCLLASGCKLELIPFIGNVFAGLKTKIIGNKSPVSKASLIKAITAILK